jgi:hypothetical protein
MSEKLEGVKHAQLFLKVKSLAFSAQHRFLTYGENEKLEICQDYAV